MRLQSTPEQIERSKAMLNGPQEEWYCVMHGCIWKYHSTREKLVDAAGTNDVTMSILVKLLRNMK